MIKELHAGDKQIPASGWNEMRAAVQGITPAQKQYNGSQRNPVYITIKNITGSDLPAFSVVKLSGATYTRSGDTFINQAIAHGVELNGDTPAAATDTIAITQADCPAGDFVKALLSGATAVKVYKPDNVNYKYAKPTATQTDYLTGSDTVTGIKVLWIAAGTGTKEAFVQIDDTDDREYFIINAGNDGTQTATHTPSIFTKGSLHYITYNGSYWEPASLNEASASSTVLQRPTGSRLVVCQVDAPSSAAECRIPYFTPESNMGVPPAFSSSFQFSWGAKRCGCKPGEHVFTDKMYDYNVSFNSGVNVGSSGNSSASASYEYDPQFTAIVTVDDNYGGAGVAYAQLNNEHWQISFPSAASGLSAACYPDIYPLDEIVVQIDCERRLCLALDYSTDYESGTIMAFYGSAPGRGWEQYSTPASLSSLGIYLYLKVKTDAYV